MAKWLEIWKQWWDILALGSPARSISRRVGCSSLLICTIATLKEAWAPNLKACHVHDSKQWEWVRLWWVWLLWHVLWL